MTGIAIVDVLQAASPGSQIIIAWGGFWARRVETLLHMKTSLLRLKRACRSESRYPHGV